MKKVLSFVVLLLILPCVVSARSKTGCDYTLLANLKKIASNVNTSYTYRIIDDIVYFDITLTNIHNDIYFVDNSTGNTYNFSNTNNGIITINDYKSGKVSFTFYSNNGDCLNEKLVVKSVNLPYYNKFYHRIFCEGIEEFSLCQRWIKYDGEYDDFLAATNSYKVSLLDDDEEVLGYVDESFFTKIIKYFTSYYYIILPISIILVVGIMYLVKYIKNRINRFDL